MGNQIKSVLRILGCSAVFLLLCVGCDLTLGPKVATRYVLVNPGIPVEILENKSVQCRILKDEDGAAVKQDIGGWIAMPPEHWNIIKDEVARLKAESGK
jgi:hypothetical protein